MKRVLFVDDEPNVLAALRRSLLPYRDRWDMQFASSATAALELMDRSPVDAVVADFRMPGMDGGQLLAEVRRLWPETGRLMLSGLTERADLIEVMSVAQTFLDKPCKRDVLAGAIDRSLRLRETLADRAARAARAQIGALDLLPADHRAVDELRAALEQGEVAERRVAQIVAGDIGLTVKILQLANSSSFGGAGEVLSVSEALRQVGLATVRSIALLRGLAAPVHDTGVLPDGWLARLNESAGTTARIAAQLAGPEQAEEAFCAALLQECGQLVFAACRPDALAELLAEGPAQAPVDEAGREDAMFGASHARAGAYLLSLWGLPSKVVDAVATHDLPPGPARIGPLEIVEATRSARVIAAERSGAVCLAASAHESPRPQTPARGVPDQWIARDDIDMEMQP